MTTILKRYIAKTVILATALIGVIIASVLFIMTLLVEMKNIGHGDYGFAEAVIYVLMRMPSALYQFAPMLILLGSIAGLSMLSSYRELAVMRASGFSIRQIIGSVLGAGLILTFVLGGIGEVFAPKMSYVAEIDKENDKNSGQAVVTAAGIWLHVDNNFIHVQHVVGHHLLEGVTRYQFDDEHHLQAAYRAKTLTLEGSHWVMIDAVKTTFSHDRAYSQSFAREDWDLKFNTNLLNIGMVEPHDMSLPKLAKFASYLEKNGLQSSQYRFEFWQRVFQPIASLVMIFLAIPFVLSAFARSSFGWRMVVGILVGFFFFISNSFFGQVCIVYQVPPVLAASLPLLGFGLLGAVLSRRLIRR